ncbi:MAG: RagB/SusD family nutrient uptake outer membrane protein [Chitinophagaceae bacterium]|nr:RagB/SusD family nutrient uptake outer membrane protein [Chitinophagaceae bacterium]
MKTFVAVIIAAFLFAGTSCKKFLAAYSQNKTFLQTVDDLEEVLVGDGYVKDAYWVNNAFMDDDAEYHPQGGEKFLLFGIHFWQQNPEQQSFVGQNSLYAVDYRLLYQNIAALNTVLLNIPLLREKNAPADRLRRISGESHFLRAYYYFLLVSMYGQPYNSATAETDFGVPLKLTPEVESAPLSRASVQQVFKQMETDLLDAEKELNGFNEASAIRANQATAQALLSRLYLYREDYANAVLYANKVIEKRYKLKDMNAWTPAAPFNSSTSPEVIYSIPSEATPTSNMCYMMQDVFTVETGVWINYRASDDLKSIFSNKDLRLSAFFKITDNGDFLARKSGEKNSSNVVTDLSTIRLPEIYLNKAEALAILDRNEEAIATLQELRKNRFKPADLTVIHLSGAPLVEFIRNERRRELCFEYHRWFDLRRYAVNSKYPFGRIIRHISYAWDISGRYEEGYYELRPYAEEPAAYVLPVPRSEIDFGRGVISNAARPARNLMH